MAYYLVLTRYVVAESLHGCLYCTVVPLCKLFNYRHHKHAPFKQTNKKNEYGYLWSVTKHPALQKYFRHRWAFHFSRCSMADECSRGKKIICEFLSLFKTSKLSQREWRCQRSAQNSLAFTALSVAPEKTIFCPFKDENPGARRTATFTTACLATCSLIISHNKKGTGLYLIGLLHPSTQAT